MGQLLLGVDVGTYSSKGVLVEPDGTVLKAYVIEHTMDIPKPGWAEQDADKVWWHDVAAICRALLDGSPYSGDDVAGVAVSAIGACMLPLDAAGKPLRPGILYGVDTRASEEIGILNEAIGADSIFEFSGMALSSQAIGPKILWMKRNEPELWKRVDHLTTASSYIILRLTGEKVIDRHTASHYMPLVDIQALLLQHDPTALSSLCEAVTPTGSDTSPRYFALPFSIERIVHAAQSRRQDPERAYRIRQAKV